MRHQGSSRSLGSNQNPISKNRANYLYHSYMHSHIKNIFFIYHAYLFLLLVEGIRQRKRHRNTSCDSAEEGIRTEDFMEASKHNQASEHWRRILLLIVAITVHNIPEGLAVGVGFGAVGKTSSATFESARNLAIGIGIQNFPEGLAVSLPLKAAGFSNFKSIW